MGLVHAKIRLSNATNSTLEPIEVVALVDTGVNFLCIPEHLALQLGLTELEKREVTVADGKRHLCPYVGPIKINYMNRQCFVGALVLGQSVLLGAMPLEDMDLVVIPSQLKLIPNPENPNIAGAIVC